MGLEGDWRRVRCVDSCKIREPKHSARPEPLTDRKGHMLTVRKQLVRVKCLVFVILLIWTGFYVLLRVFMSI